VFSFKENCGCEIANYPLTEKGWLDFLIETI
jgi:hypothetical protein